MNRSNVNLGPLGGTHSYGWQELRRTFYLGALLCVPLVLICIKWFDLPFATWLHSSQIDIGLPWFRYFMAVPVIVAPFAPIYLLVYVLRRSRAAGTFHEYVWFVISVTFLAACEIKNMLKIGFGRTWPRDVASTDFDLVLPGLVSKGYITDGIHLFRPFAGIKAFTSFPSGSTVIVLAAIVPIFANYPRARVPLVALGAATIFSLIQTNTHFISDVVAGLYIGLVIGMVAAIFISQERTARGIID